MTEGICKDLLYTNKIISTVEVFPEFLFLIFSDIIRDLISSAKEWPEQKKYVKKTIKLKLNHCTAVVPPSFAQIHSVISYNPQKKKIENFFF